MNHKMTENSDNSSVIRLLAEQAEQKLIPEKSKEAYLKEYEKFSKWMVTTNQTVIDETLMLAYMNKMSSLYKSSSMWCIHSKLQTMLRIKHGVNIASFHKLHAFMKSANKGHEPKKSWVFTEEELRKFFITAADDTFLFLKVVTICGIFGSCRRKEMCDLRMSDIKEEGSLLLITIRPCKTQKGRKFAVTDDSVIPYVQIFKKYLSLRPDQVPTDRVFLKYSKGKCIRQVVGVNTFGQCPCLVATYLKLPDAKKYTGHAFRRTSATIMANSGMSVDELKRQVGWRSSTVASSYIEESTANKLSVSKRILGALNGSNTITTVDSKSIVFERTMDQESSDQEFSTSLNNSEVIKHSGLQFSNNNNCTINVYLPK